MSYIKHLFPRFGLFSITHHKPQFTLRTYKVFRFFGLPLVYWESFRQYGGESGHESKD